MRKGINNDEFGQFYSAYGAIRDNKKIKDVKIKISSAEKLLNILEKELNQIGVKLYDKSQKEAAEGN